MKIEYQHISVQQDQRRQKPTSRELPYATTSKERAIIDYYVKAVGETQRVESRMTDSTQLSDTGLSNTKLWTPHAAPIMAMTAGLRAHPHVRL